MVASGMPDEQLAQAISELEEMVEKDGPLQQIYRQQLEVLCEELAARQAAPSDSRALVATPSGSRALVVTPSGSRALVATPSDLARLAELEAENERLRQENARLQNAEADEADELHVVLDYPLFQPGDQITTYTGEQITVTASMHGLLGTADNRLAKLPKNLIEFARHFLAMLVTMNNTVMHHGDRFKVPMYSTAEDALPGQYSSEFSPSVLMQFMANRHDSCRIMPEQCVKSYETAQLCCYSRLVLGCVPVVSVRNCGGRIVAAGSMKDSLDGVLSLKGKEMGLLPSTNDIVRELLAMPEHRKRKIRRHELDRYFFVEAEEVQAGKSMLNENVISVLLQNETASNKMPRLQQVLHNGVGVIQLGGDKQHVARVEARRARRGQRGLRRLLWRPCCRQRSRLRLSCQRRA